MSDAIENLVAKIRTLETQLENELSRARNTVEYRLEHGRVVFEEEVLRQHRKLKTGLWRYISGARPLIALTAPIIYALIVPMALLDLCVSLYQAVCFPVYGLKKVRRRDYIALDRHHLAYLNALEKLNCAYCSYANGLLAYVREIAARTESYWCPIKHARRVAGVHGLYREFAEFGDAAAFKAKMDELDSQAAKPD
jgi:hypothetical protein